MFFKKKKKNDDITKNALEKCLKDIEDEIKEIMEKIKDEKLINSLSSNYKKNEKQPTPSDFNDYLINGVQDCMEHINTWKNKIVVDFDLREDNFYFAFASLLGSIGSSVIGNLVALLEGCPHQIIKNEIMTGLQNSLNKTEILGNTNLTVFNIESERMQ